MEEMNTVVNDDLTKIEGIAPAVAEVLNGAGINTYANLAETSPETLNELMNEAGPEFSFRDTSTWTEQASMASEGRWDELRTWQYTLQGGEATASAEEE